MSKNWRNLELNWVRNVELKMTPTRVIMLKEVEAVDS